MTESLVEALTFILRSLACYVDAMSRVLCNWCLQAYRELADRVVTRPQLDDSSTDTHLQQVALLTKARDALLSTFGNVARKNNQVRDGRKNMACSTV